MLILSLILLSAVQGDEGGWTSLLEATQEEAENLSEKEKLVETGGEAKQKLTDGWTSLREANKLADDLEGESQKESEGEREGKQLGFPFNSGYYNPSQLFQQFPSNQINPNKLFQNNPINSNNLINANNLFQPQKPLAPSPPPLGPILPTIFNSNLAIHPATNPFSGEKKVNK